MTIKTQLSVGVWTLFLIILVLGGVSIHRFTLLKSETENILENNYNSLVFCTGMLESLEQDNLAGFIKNLEQQEKNVTEAGEEDATLSIRKMANSGDSSLNRAAVKANVRQSILKIMQLNMDAISRKSSQANKTADTANLWIASTGALSFLLAFILLVNLPSAIARPIKELTLGIRQISKKNYSERVPVSRNDEFGELAKAFNSMAEKLEEYNSTNMEQLMMEKKRLDTLLASMQDPVIGMDENGIVLFANPMALQVTGLAKETLTGKSYVNLSNTNDLIKTITHTEIAPSSKPVKISVNGRECYFEKEEFPISVRTTGESEKKNIGKVIILRNVTGYKELDYARTNFIATVSHEFKTPIASIQMSLQLLENRATGTLNPEQKNLIDSIREDAGRLLRITSELLNITQVESGKIPLNITKTPIDNILNYALTATRNQADQKQISILMQTEKQVRDVFADAEKAAWVLTNLISNAIRYSPENSEITISMNYNSGFILFTVKDNGKGIEENYRKRIFERYFRVPGSGQEGTGLGLAISKEFIEAMRGKIWVESEPGSGSIFGFTLPAAG